MKKVEHVLGKGVFNDKTSFKTVFAGRELVVETGQVAKQANGRPLFDMVKVPF